MGNTNSELFGETQTYNVIQQGKGVTLLQDKKTNEELCLRELVFHNEKQFQEHKALFEAKLNRAHRHLTQLKQVKVNTGFYKCSNLYRLGILFDHPFKTLRNEIQQRKATNSYFKQNEVLSILYSCLSGLRQLNDWGFSHNGIRADTVFIAENGFIKLSQPKLIDDLNNLDLLRIQSDDPNLVISPQQILFWTEGRIYNLNKSDIYSIGMIMLEAVTFIPPRQFYSDDHTEADQAKIQTSLDEIASRYSNKLRGLLKNMLEPHPEKRGSVEEIMHLMYQREETEPNVENRENIKENFYKTTKISKSMKSSMVLSATNPPIIRVRKEQKEGLQNEFPQPSSATVWVNKNQVSYVEQSTEQPKALENSATNLPPKTKIIRIIPNKLQSQKIPRTPNPCLQTLATMKEDLQKISLTSHECLQFIRQRSFPLCKSTVSKTGMTTLHNQSNHTISEVTEPEHSNLEQTRQVVEHHQDGSYYQGEKCGNLRHGYGVFHYKDGGYYQGEWKYDKMEGKGRLFYQKERIAYDGEWKNDEFDGFGKVFNDKPNFRLKNQFDNLDFGELDDFWLYYQGQFVKDVKCGKGKVMLTNGDIFQGIFVNDIVHGKGKITKVHGQKIEGEWADNKFLKQ